MVGVLLEGGLGALAFLVGSAAGHDPAADLEVSAHDAFLGIAAVGPLLLVLLVCLRSRWGPLARLRDVFDEVMRPVLGSCTWLDLAVLSAAAGIGEELLFRGLIQGLLGHGRGPLAGLAVASLLFGLAHPITATYVVVAGLMGAYLGAIWLATGNLLVPIVAHAVYDFLALAWLVKLRPTRGIAHFGRSADRGDPW